MRREPAWTWIKPEVRPGRCAKSILVIFGYLFLMTLLFVPCTTTWTKVRPHANPGFMIRTTVPRNVYIFLPQVLASKDRGTLGPAVRVKTFQWLASVTLVLLLGVSDYFLFCRLLRIGRGPRAGADSESIGGAGGTPSGPAGFSLLR